MNNSLSSGTKHKKIVYLAQKSVDNYRHNDLYYSAMAEACDYHGINLYLLDIGGDHWQEQLLAYAKDEDVLFFFGLNGFGNDLSIEREENYSISLFEYAEKPYITSFSDPPFIAEMWEHTRAKFRGKIYVYTDHSYFSISKLFQDLEQTQNIYFYSGFCPTIYPEPNDNQSIEKDINILCAATLIDPDIYYQSFLVSCQKELVLAKKIFESIVDNFLFDLRSDCLDWINQGFIRNGLLFDLQINWHRNLLDCVSGYIKFRRRQMMLQNLQEVPLTIMSKGSPYKLSTHPDTKIIPPVSFQEFQQILAKTKICLCPTPHYRGFHERVISAMYANCLVLTTPNQVLEQEFVHGQSIVFFQDLERDLIQKLEDYDRNPEAIKGICARAREIAQDKFSARKALDRFLTIYQNYRSREREIYIHSITHGIPDQSSLENTPSQVESSLVVDLVVAEDIVQLEKTVAEQQQELQKLNMIVEAMRTSKFWKMRKAWFMLKKSIGWAKNELI
jgi:glycosyltransferase involved in cell wall biosynthesis